MEFLTANNFKNIFSKLIEEYDSFSWTVAWAGSIFETIELMEKYIHKFNRMVFGIHFYQTHPDFIKKFYKNKNVRFMLQPSGIFHPKLYLFENKTKWSIIIGSHNLTNNAFNLNSEASILINSSDKDSEGIKNKVDEFINKSWKMSKTLSENNVLDYNNIYLKQSPKIKELGLTVKLSKDKKNLLLEIVKMTWQNYYSEIVELEFKERLRLLDTAQNLFNKYKSFKNIPLIDRKGLAGFYDNDLEKDGFSWFAFGNMRGAGYFKQAINNNNKYISDSLDCIPANGNVSRSDFISFKKLFFKGISNSHNPTATATRLLSMKRPDYFFCFNSKNRKGIAKAFEIKENLNLIEYWDLVLEKIYQSEWWNDISIKDDIELKTFNYRTAFIDNLYFGVF